MSKSLNHPATLPTFAKGTVVTATLETSVGDIVCRLHADDCPVTVGNFVGLATGEIPWNSRGKTGEGPLYNDTIFHRVIPDFMIQAGDPEGTGMGGPGYKFGDECVAHLKHDRPGILSMANAGPGTNGSQFFITEAATPWLNGRHTVFGEVTDGITVVHAIAQAPRDGSDRPKEQITLKRIRIEQTPAKEA